MIFAQTDLCTKSNIVVPTGVEGPAFDWITREISTATQLPARHVACLAPGPSSADLPVTSATTQCSAAPAPPAWKRSTQLARRNPSTTPPPRLARFRPAEAATGTE